MKHCHEKLMTWCVSDVLSKSCDT